MRHRSPAAQLAAALLMSCAFAPTATAAEPTAVASRAPAAAGPLAWEKLPDWSGVWLASGDPNGGPFQPFDRATAEPPGNNGMNPGDRVRPPYNAEWEAKYGALLAEQRAGKHFDPLTYCLPPHFPRFLVEPFYFEFSVRPDGVRFISELFSMVRRIYTDGRGHPSEDDLFPMWQGHSIGRWEGEGEGATLVVDTISIRAGQFDRTGAPFSDRLHTVERIRKINPTTIEIDVTLEDPAAFTRPWKVKRYFKKDVQNPRPILVDWVCDENNRAVNKHGGTDVILPGESGYKAVGQTNH